MSGKVKSIIAIVIAAVAVVAIATVVVLSSIVIRPVYYANGWLDDIETAEIYHSSAEGYLLHTDETNKPVITINPYKTYLHQRFSIFLALGNFINKQHQNIKNNTYATKFAEEMIVPTDVFLHFVNHTNLSIRDMVVEFNVSSEAISDKLKKLGIL